MIWISSVVAIVVAFFVGYGCFEWGKSKAKDEQFKITQQEKNDKNKQDLQEKERTNKQHEALAAEKDKELRLIKSVAKNHGIKFNDTQLKGTHFMIKEKYGSIPIDPNEIYKFIKQNVLNIKEQE